MIYGIQWLSRFLCVFYLSGSDAELCCCFSCWTAEQHSLVIFFFAARCVLKSSSAHVTLSRIALNLLICWVVSCYKVRLPIRVNIMPCGCVTKLEGSDCLFLWLCQMFLWVPNCWHEVLSPGRDRVPCSCFCGQTHWELRLFIISRRTPTSLTMFIGFSPWGVSHAAFPLWIGIIYELSSGGKGLSLPPALH